MFSGPFFRGQKILSTREESVLPDQRFDAAPESDQWRLRARSRMGELGITQGQLADAIGALPSRVGHYLTGRNEPPLAHLMLICRALRVSSDWLLFGGTNEPLDLPRSEDDLAERIRNLDKSARGDIESYLRVKSFAG